MLIVDKIVSQGFLNLILPTFGFFLTRILQRALNWTTKISPSKLTRRAECCSKGDTKCARDDSASEACKTLHWLPVEHMVSFKINTQVYKALNDSAPKYVSSLQNIKDSRRTLCSSDY